MSAKRSKKIKGEKGQSLTVYPWTHPKTGASRWRFAWRDGDKWRYSTHKTKAEAEEGAWNILGEMEAGGLLWSALSPARQAFLAQVNAAVRLEDEKELLRWVKARENAEKVEDAVARFMAERIARAGEETPHLRNVRGILEGMAKYFKGRAIAEIHRPDLVAWFEERGKGLSGKRRNGIRGDLVLFWRWCLREGLAGIDPITTAEKLPMVAINEAEKRILTGEEFAQLCRAVAPRWRVCLVLCGLAGMRPEEVAPTSIKKAAKRGLWIEEIDWRFRVIRVPSCVSKVGRPRIIPMCDGLEDWLAWAGITEGMTGAACVGSPVTAGEWRRLGVEIFGGAWPKDALRHSYGSYRNALLRSLEVVAEEMGTSVEMLHRHYHNPRAEAEGLAWFSAKPPLDPICSDEIEVCIEEYKNLKSSKTL